MNKLKSKTCLLLRKVFAPSLLLTVFISILVHFITFGVFFTRPVLELEEVVELDFFESVPRKQVVETEESLNDKVPKKARYLGKNNQSVEKESKSRNVNPFRVGKKVEPKVLDLKKLVPSAIREFYASQEGSCFALCEQ